VQKLSWILQITFLPYVLFRLPSPEQAILRGGQIIFLPISLLVTCLDLGRGRSGLPVFQLFDDAQHVVSALLEQAEDGDDDHAGDDPGYP
jgi:hypothetical protein